MVMKNVVVLAVMLLVAPSIGVADDTVWGDLGGGAVARSASAASGTLADTEAISQVPVNTTNESTIPCGQNDPRMQRLLTILKDLKAGKEIEPLQMNFGTYMDLSPKVRKLLGDNIIISAVNCKNQFLLDGELTGKAEMPFPEALGYINDAIRAQNNDVLQFIFTNVKASPETLHNIMNYSVVKAFPLATGQQLITAAAIQAVQKNNEEMGILLLDIYQALMGRLASGEKSKVYIWANAKNIFVRDVFSDDGYRVTVSSGGHSASKVTFLAPSRLVSAFSGIGVSPEVSSINKRELEKFPWFNEWKNKKQRIN